MSAQDEREERLAAHVRDLATTLARVRADEAVMMAALTSDPMGRARVVVLDMLTDWPNRATARERARDWLAATAPDRDTHPEQATQPDFNDPRIT